MDGDCPEQHQQRQSASAVLQVVAKSNKADTLEHLFKSRIESCTTQVVGLEVKRTGDEVGSARSLLPNMLLLCFPSNAHNKNNQNYTEHRYMIECALPICGTCLL